MILTLSGGSSKMREREKMMLANELKFIDAAIITVEIEILAKMKFSSPSEHNSLIFVSKFDDFCAIVSLSM
jgi:hypothetical protein